MPIICILLLGLRLGFSFGVYFHGLDKDGMALELSTNSFLFSIIE